MNHAAGGDARRARWWTVVTDHGTIVTKAVSPGKAKRNARYRIAMDGRRGARPNPAQLARMRDVEVISVEERDDD